MNPSSSFVHKLRADGGVPKQLTLLKVYRGHWCPFCISYLKSLEALTPSIKGANGIPLIITAESAENQEKTRAASGYTGHAISDPDNDIASEMRKGGAVDVYFSEKKGYPNGMAQPAVVLIKTDGTVMYSWAITPSTVSGMRYFT